MNFEILPFALLPPHIRWFTGLYNNKEYGEVLFETVDDVDDADCGFDLMYGVMWEDDEYGVYDDYYEALWAVISGEDS